MSGGMRIVMRGRCSPPHIDTTWVLKRRNKAIAPLRPDRGWGTRRRVLPSWSRSFRSSGWTGREQQRAMTVKDGRVEMWRGCGRSDISVSAPFVWRCLSGSTVAPFPHPAHRTGRADFPHPARGQDLMPLFWRATPSAGPEPFLELIGRLISQVLPYVLRLS